MFCEAEHLFQQIQLQQWNPSGPWTWVDNICFFVRSLLDLVWNGFVYTRFWRFNCLAWHYNTACRSASVALFCSESAGNTARAAEKTNRRRAAKYKLHMARQPWRNDFISACKLWIHRKATIFCRDEWGTLLQRIYHKIEGNSSSKPFSLGVMFVLGRFSGACPRPKSDCKA